MNTKKGMFRVWVVLSIAWLPIAVAFLRPNFPDASWYSTLHAQRKSQEIHNSNCSIASNIRGECEGMPKLRQEKTLPLNQPKTANESASAELTGDALSKYEQAKTRYWVKLAAVTAIPPLSLLILGLIVIYSITPIAMWVVKGFRNK